MSQMALSIEQVKAATGLGRTKIYQLINSGRIPARKVGRSTRILQSDLDTFLTGLDSYPVKLQEHKR